MDLILTMAGKYTRFTDKGYKLPKYLLPWGNRSILSEIIKQMSHNFDNTYLIMNKRDIDFIKHIKMIIKEYNIPEKNLIVIDDTKSQSETALIGLENINCKKSIVFHNIDTILYNRDYEYIRKCLESSDGFIDIFASNNCDYSYITLVDNEVNEIVEKVLISDIATSGMYGFKDFETFKSYYNNGYISDIYRSMIKDMLIVKTGHKHSELDTIVLGTPDEYINLSNII